MKRFLNRLFVAALTAGVLLSAMSCRKARIIPDSTLSKIFYEAFLTNAYLAEKRPSTDSLELYEPIFEKYGYTVEDLQYTIGNFSKRKSARLGNVVEVAIARLEAEGTVLDRETAILDTIDARARRRFTRTLVADTLRTVYKLSDTTRLHVTVDSLQRGDYEVSFAYNIDSLDKNGRMRIYIRSERQDSTLRVELNNLMQRRTDRTVSHTVKNDGSLRRLHISIAEPDSKSKRERPHITIRDLTVRYLPYAEDVVDSLYEQTLNLGIFNMSLLEPAPAASPADEPAAAAAQTEEHNATDSLTPAAAAR